LQELTSSDNSGRVSFFPNQAEADEPRAESAMGKESGETQAHHVSISSQEDRGVSAGEVGEVEGAAEESGVGSDSGLRLPDKHESPTLD